VLTDSSINLLDQIPDMSRWALMTGNQEQDFYLYEMKMVIPYHHRKILN
jgi:hypothetical protein